MLRKPPDILITTPESLYLMLTSRAHEILTGTEAVIVDEIHAVARETEERCRLIQRPNVALRVAVALVIVAASAAVATW